MCELLDDRASPSHREPIERPTLRWLGIAAVAVALVLDLDLVRAAVHKDAHGRVELEVRQTLSPVNGFIGAEFFVRPLDESQVVSTIDAATAGRGFAAPSLRQVNPFGQPTVFADFNAVMSPTDRVLGDSQFTFASSQVIVAPGTQLESSTALRAAFTGFPPITAQAAARFVQLVLPWGTTGVFSGTFAVRPAGGGAPQATEFVDIAFGLEWTPSDFDRNHVVDGADLIAWQQLVGVEGQEPFAPGDADGDGAVGTSDLASWQQQFARPLNAGSSVPAKAVPEPPALEVVAALSAWGAAAAARPRLRPRP